LGSSRFITVATGISTQHLQYLPFGELFVKQCDNSNYYSSYKFSAKEKDEETSYSYFGARYLASDFSFWLSEDPMADKYPNISPYNYCHWNPVRLIDPNGLEAGDPTDFGVKNNGEVVRIGEINNEPDRLFAINDDGTKKSVDPITVNNKTILPELAIARQLVNRQDDAGTVVEEGVLRHTSSKDKQDMAKLFLFMAKNTMKEWSMYFDKKSNNVSLGTYQYEDTSPGPKSYGNESINTSMSIHFHPGETSESEVESLYGDRSTVTKVPYSYYIFLPNSSNLYKLSKDGNKAYIKRNINFETIINILK
jgi:RHS repeat-associated protein